MLITSSAPTLNDFYQEVVPKINEILSLARNSQEINNTLNVRITPIAIKIFNARGEEASLQEEQKSLYNGDRKVESLRPEIFLKGVRQFFYMGDFNVEPLKQINAHIQTTADIDIGICISHVHSQIINQEPYQLERLEFQVELLDKDNATLTTLSTLPLDFKEPNSCVIS